MVDKRFLMISLGVSWRFSSGSSEDRKVHSESTKLLEGKTDRRLNSRGEFCRVLERVHPKKKSFEHQLV